MPSSPTQFTELLRQWSGGDKRAFEKLVPVIYKELRRLARGKMAGERVGHSWQGTDLVHEAYLSLVGYKNVHWESRKHFYAVCAEIMQHILVDHWREKNSKKRGGDLRRTSFDEAIVALRPFDVLQFNEALQALRKINRRQADIVGLRFLVGLSVKETAEVLEVAPQTILRDWHFAKLWLLHYMKGQVNDDA